MSEEFLPGNWQLALIALFQGSIYLRSIIIGVCNVFSKNSCVKCLPLRKKWCLTFQSISHKCVAILGLMNYMFELYQQYVRSWEQTISMPQTYRSVTQYTFICSTTINVILSHHRVTSIKEPSSLLKVPCSPLPGTSGRWCMTGSVRWLSCCLTWWREDRWRIYGHIVQTHTLAVCCYSIQEVCCQYWPSSGSVEVGEFTVELLQEEELQGFVLRTLSVQHSHVSLHFMC